MGVLRYGVGNIGSLVNAFKRLGADVEILEDSNQLKNVDLLVLPGVGSFDAAIKYIDEKVPEVRKIAGSVPVLGICLGMQIMFEESEEGTLRGLCWFSGKVKLLKSYKIPHIGWNTISRVRDSPVLENIPDGSYFYFAHSYCVYYSENVTVARAVTTFDETTFVSVLADEEKCIFGTQFHPERSSKPGLQFLRNVLKMCTR